MKKRKAKWKQPKPPLERGYWRLYFDHVQQADKGADLGHAGVTLGAAVLQHHHAGFVDIQCFIVDAGLEIFDAFEHYCAATMPQKLR